MASPACERCGSRSLYRDDNPVTGTWAVACRCCGGRHEAGTIPAVQEKLADEHKPTEREEMNMEKLDRACGNCKRTGLHLNGRLCGVCSVAGRGKVGQARDAALDEIRKKIEAGELGTADGRNLRSRRWPLLQARWWPRNPTPAAMLLRLRRLQAESAGRCPPVAS